MSSTTRTRKTHTNTDTTGSTQPLRAVPDQDIIANVRTDAEDRLWKALHANPNSRVTDLANTAEIGKSTAAKILVKWHQDRDVTRTPGIAEGGRRAADLWAITTTETDTDVGTEPTIEHTSTADVSTSDADSADSTQPDPSALDTSAPETTVVADTKVPDAQFSDAQPGDSDTTEATSAQALDTATAEPGGEATTPADDTTATDGHTAAEGSDGDGKKERLAPFALRGLVEDHLREHPGEEFGPTAIAKALGGKSSGAVSNALDKLVDAGTAVKTKESPRRFALAPAEQEAASAATT